MKLFGYQLPKYTMTLATVISMGGIGIWFNQDVATRPQIYQYDRDINYPEGYAFDDTLIVAFIEDKTVVCQDTLDVSEATALYDASVEAFGKYDPMNTQFHRLWEDEIRNGHPGTIGAVFAIAEGKAEIEFQRRRRLWLEPWRIFCRPRPII